MPTERSIPLACCSCAAPLRVPGRAIRFSCGWCETIQQLVFDGGAYFSEPYDPRTLVSSNPEFIVSAPTDPRAAGAALAGLEAEIDRLESEYRRVLAAIAQSYDSRLDRVRRREEGILGCGAIALSGAVILVLLLPQFSQKSVFAIAGVAGATLFVAMAVLGWHHENRNDAEALREESLDRLAAVRFRTEREMRQLAGELERARAIARG
jgi:hypothetical protein